MDKLLGNELFVKLLAVVLAVLIYAQVVGQGVGASVQRTVVGVQLGFVNRPADLVIQNWQPRTVNITVSGSSALVNGLLPSSLGASVNLSAAHAGSAKYFVNVSVPPGLTLVKSQPQDVTVVTEAVTERDTAVQVHVRGVVGTGFGLGSPTLSQKLVVLRGAVSAIDQVVQTVVAVDVQGARAPIRTQAVPEPLDKQGKPVKGVTVVPGHIEVTVPVAPAVPQRRVRVRPAVSGAPASGYHVVSVTASPSTVDLLGTGSVIAGISSVRAQPLPLNGATHTLHASELIVAPSGVESVQPGAVQVTATIARG